jgi:hypothetical protein
MITSRKYRSAKISTLYRKRLSLFFFEIGVTMFLGIVGTVVLCGLWAGALGSLVLAFTND